MERKRCPECGRNEETLQARHKLRFMWSNLAHSKRTKQPSDHKPTLAESATSSAMPIKERKALVSGRHLRRKTQAGYPSRPRAATSSTPSNRRPCSRPVSGRRGRGKRRQSCAPRPARLRLAQSREHDDLRFTPRKRGALNIHMCFCFARGLHGASAVPATLNSNEARRLLGATRCGGACGLRGGWPTSPRIHIPPYSHEAARNISADRSLCHWGDQCGQARLTTAWGKTPTPRVSMLCSRLSPDPPNNPTNHVRGGGRSFHAASLVDPWHIRTRRPGSRSAYLYAREHSRTTLHRHAKPEC